MTANIAKIVCPRTFSSHTQSLVAKGSLQDLQVSLATITLQFKENMLQAEAFAVQKEQQSRNISLLMSMSDQNRQIKQPR